MMPNSPCIKNSDFDDFVLATVLPALLPLHAAAYSIGCISTVSALLLWPYDVSSGQACHPPAAVVAHELHSKSASCAWISPQDDPHRQYIVNMLCLDMLIILAKFMLMHHQLLESFAQRRNLKSCAHWHPEIFFKAASLSCREAINRDFS